MFSLALASAISIAVVQNAAANSARTALTACLKSVVEQAVKDNIALDALTPRMKETCSAPAGKLKAALVAFDAKNGISRRQAAADADLQLEDYYAVEEERFEYELGKKNKTASASSN